MANNHWKGAQDWDDVGMKLSTGSEEVCKLFDAAVTQLITWTDDESLGGMKGTLGKIIATDPNFLLGHVLACGLQILSGSHNIREDEQLKEAMAGIDKMLSQGSNFTEREKKHAEAVQYLYEGFFVEATEKWEEILLSHPHDLLALKLAQYLYFFLGASQQIRDSVARVLPQWRPEMPLYGNVHSMHAFGLHECYMLTEAEVAAKKALNINSKDAWATHALCHVMEMSGRAKEGSEFLENTVEEWKPGNMIACHTNWHWAIYYVELGDYESALSIFDNELRKRANDSGSVHDFSDMASLLFRLQMEGVNVGERWDKVYDQCKKHLHDHNIAFYDLHILLSCLRADKPKAVTEMMESIKKFIKTNKGLTRDVMSEVGEQLLQSFSAYNDGDYAEAVNLLNPIRYKVFKIGGSHAQRDLINLFLIQAAMKSPCNDHNKLARALLNERKCLKPNSPLTDRLVAKTLALHGD